jgi:predicted HicB family RNase H-like nuclease
VFLLKSSQAETKTLLTDDRPLKKITNAARIKKSEATTMSTVHSIPVRVPEELRERLEAEAKAADRSMSSLVRVLLQEAFSKRSAEQQGAS